MAAIKRYFLLQSVCLLILILAFTEFSQAQAICEVRINPEQSRQIDITFPNGRLVSVVGHRHPDRGYETEAKMFELISTSAEDWSPVAKDRFHTRLRETLDTEQLAIDHFREDQNRLENDLARRRYQNINVESMPKNFNRNQIAIDAVAPVIDRNLSAAGFSAADQADIRLIGLGAPDDLRLRKPNLFLDAKITTAEGTEDEIAAQEKLCGPKTSPQFSGWSNFIFALSARLPQHDVFMLTKTAASAASDHFFRISPFFRAKTLRAEDLTDTFTKTLPLPLTSSEKSMLTQFYRHQIENSLTVDSCLERDLISARNLAHQEGNSIMFLGQNHLKNQAVLLAEECRKQMSPTTTASSGSK